MIVYYLLSLTAVFVLLKAIRGEQKSQIEQMLDSQEIVYQKTIDMIMITSYDELTLNIELQNDQIYQYIWIKDIKNLTINSISLHNMVQNKAQNSGQCFLNINDINILQINSIELRDVSLIDCFISLHFPNTINQNNNLSPVCKVNNIKLISTEMKNNLFSVKSQSKGSVIFDTFTCDFLTLKLLKTTYVIYIDQPQSLKIINFVVPSINKFDEDTLTQYTPDKSFSESIEEPQTKLQNNVNENQNTQQISFFYITNSGSAQNILFREIDVDFNNYFIRFALFRNVTGDIYSENSKFSHMRSFDYGGCVYIDGGAVFYLNRTVFDGCQSGFFGGAVYGGILINLPNTINIIQNCVSTLAGGVFGYWGYFRSDFIFINNTAVAYPNGFACPRNGRRINCNLFQLAKMYQLNYQFEGTSYYMRENNFILSEIFNKFERIPLITSKVFSSFTYILRFDVVENDILISEFNSSQPIGNLYNLLQDKYKQNYIPINIQNMSFPYLVFSNNPSFECHSDSVAEIYSLYLDSVVFEESLYGCLNITRTCTPGMQTIPVYTQIGLEEQCQYCRNGMYSYQSETECIPCREEIFDQCYADQTSLKGGFWRQKYSNEISDIYECSLNKNNCKGNNRFDIENGLCVQGYIGVQCLECDRNGLYWNSTYGRSGLFNCTECSSNKNNNNTVIILLSIFYLFLLAFSLSSNFSRMKNQVYRTYLSKMGIVYIGQSFISQSLTSVYLKMLLFNFQIYQTSMYLSFQQNSSSILQYIIPSFTNPFQVSTLSVDCFLNELFPQFESLGYLRLILILIIPIIINIILILILLILMKVSRLQFKYVIALMIHAINYVILFQFQPQIIEQSIQSIQCIQLTEQSTYLLLDFSLNCNNTPYIGQIHAIGALTLLLYSILTPLILLFFLVRNRHQFDRIRILFFFGFLFDEYKRKLYFWEFTKLLLIILLQVLINILRTNIQTMVLILCVILSAYLFAILTFKPYQQQKLNKIESISILISIFFLLSSLNEDIIVNSNNHQGEEGQLTNNVLSQVMYYTANTFQMLFFVSLSLLITTSFFQLSLRKLQRYKIIAIVARIFPYILTKVYSPRLNQNIKLMKKLIMKQQLNEGFMNLELSSGVAEEDKLLRESKDIINLGDP